MLGFKYLSLISSYCFPVTAERVYRNVYLNKYLAAKFEVIFCSLQKLEFYVVLSVKYN